MKDKALRLALEAFGKPSTTDEVKCPVCNDKGFPWPKCGHITYLERTPPKRKPLTDEEIYELAFPFGEFQFGDAQGHKRIEFARAIEAAHGIKGEA